MLRAFYSCAALAVLCANCVRAHDIPNDVTVQAFVKPSGQKLLLVTRVPLKAIRDVVFPARGPAGYLDLAQTAPLLHDAVTLWISDSIQIYENGRLLPKPAVVATQLSLENDRSFTSFDQALAHTEGPKLPPDTNVAWNQTLLDVVFEYPIHSDRAEFSINPDLGRLGLHVLTILRFLPPGGAVRAFELSGSPGLVRLDPSWFQAALTFVKLGCEHILSGTDHLLFLFCLVIPFRRFRSLIPIVTAFTAAHSITLLASAYDLAPSVLWFPPLIEMLIAASIVYMALENIAAKSTVQHRWIVAFGFGLVHGFGFSFGLRQTLQFAGSHLLTSLLSFNVGVEIGQLLVLMVLVPALDLLFRYVVQERMGTIILSALVAHTGWHWMTERWDKLAQYDFTWPALDAAFFASLLGWLALILAAFGAAWGVSALLRRRGQRAAPTPAGAD